MELSGNIWHSFYQTTVKVNADMHIVESGYKRCIPGHSFGPSVRGIYVLHFITSGKGVFEKNGSSFDVRAGQGFLICPNEMTTYTADKKDPWTYYWVSFSGEKSADTVKGFSASGDRPVFEFDTDGPLREYIHNLVFTPTDAPNINHVKLGWFYLALSALIMQKSAAGKVPDVIKLATEYIEQNLSYDISVDSIAKHCFVNRSHLFRVFKSALGVSPTEYLLNLRLKQTCDYLRFSNYSITYIAEIARFSDSSQYCKMFKKKFGETPLAWRKNHIDKFIAD